MNIRFVEYGKRYVPYGTTDFVTLASSDKDIEKTVEYFRRSVLLFPSKTSFNENIGSVSAALLGFSEGYLFVQIQSRREDELAGAESDMRRPFNQIRFSYLTREILFDHLIKGDAVFTSLLYNNPSNNRAGQLFRLPDYGWKSEKLQTLSESQEADIIWKKRQVVENELAQYQFGRDVELLTNLIRYHLATDIKRQGGLFFMSEIDNRVPQEIELYYKLALLQEAQALLFPYELVITFALHHITDQSVFLRFYDPESSSSSEALGVGYSSPQGNYYRTVKTLEAYIFEENFSRYIKSIDLNFKDLTLLYPLTKGHHIIEESEARHLIQRYFYLLKDSPRALGDLPEDFYNALSSFSVDEVRLWAVEETHGDIKSYLFQFLTAYPRDFFLAYTQLPDEKITDDIRSLLKSAIYEAETRDIQNLHKNQAKRFWEETLYLQRKMEINLRFVSGESILEGLLIEAICPKEIAVDLIARELRLGGQRFIDKLMEVIQELAARNLYTLADISTLLVDVEIGESTLLLSDLYIKILNLFITLREEARLNARDTKAWTRFIREIISKLGGNPLIIWTDTNALLTEEKNKFIRICSEIAREDNAFAEWLFFRSLAYASESSYAFNDIYRAIRDNFPESTLNRLLNQDKQTHSPFCYLMSVGAIPLNYSLLQTLRDTYGKTIDILPLFYILIKIWIREGWWTKQTHLGREDIEVAILNFEKSITLSDATQFNDILIVMAQSQQNQCQQLDVETAKMWLTATQKTWINPKDHAKIQFYNSYFAVTSEGKINYLWNVLSNLERPDAEILWRISGMSEAIDPGLTTCQSYVRQWQSKFEEVGIKEKKLLEYFNCASARFSENTSDGRLLITLRSLIEVKHDGIRFVCGSDKEAMHLLMITESVEDSSIESLAKQFLRKYLSKAEHISAELMSKILYSDLEVESRLIKNYLNELAAQRRLETQINNMSVKPAQKIYLWAKENSAQQVERIAERRLRQLGVR